jgi:hypothetical protein
MILPNICHWWESMDCFASTAWLFLCSCIRFCHVPGFLEFDAVVLWVKNGHDAFLGLCGYSITPLGEMLVIH